MVRKLVVGVVLVALFIAIIVGVRQVNRFWLTEPGGDSRIISLITVNEGDTLSTVIPALAESNLVQPFWFKVYIKVTGNGGYIQPGTHEITHGMSYEDIVNVLQVGAETNEVTLTIPEGFTLAQMGVRVTAAFPNITAEDWKNMTGQFSPLESHPFVVVAGKPDTVDLEGYLFPDTYKFFADATSMDIVERMIDTMEARANAVALAENLSGKITTMHEALTLASILEKEVRTAPTMANVADIFLKRLAINMALQSDATVNNITGGDDPSVSFDDLAIDSPYNTYKYPGLPPGPISNPGLNALTAVAQPTRNDYYYFLTDDAGKIYYAVTHDEHIVNKNTYLK